MCRPPQARACEDELLEFIGSESDVFGFVGCELYILFELDGLDLAFEFALDRLIRAVLELRGDSELRAVVRGRIQFRDDGWIAQRYRPAGGEVHLLPQSHVFVRWGGIPIHESDGEIVFGRGKDLHRKDVLRAGLGVVCDVELVGAPGARHVVGICNLFTVKKNIRPIIDSVKFQPHGLAFVGSRYRKRLPIPPGDRVRTVGRHRDVGKIRPDRIIDSREIAKVHAEERIGKRLVLDQRRHHGGGHAHCVPSLG